MRPPGGSVLPTAAPLSQPTHASPAASKINPSSASAGCGESEAGSDDPGSLRFQRAMREWKTNAAGSFTRTPPAAAGPGLATPIPFQAMPLRGEEREQESERAQHRGLRLVLGRAAPRDRAECHAAIAASAGRRARPAAMWRGYPWNGVDLRSFEEVKPRITRMGADKDLCNPRHPRNPRLKICLSKRHSGFPWKESSEPVARGTLTPRCAAAESFATPCESRCLIPGSATSFRDRQDRIAGAPRYPPVCAPRREARAPAPAR